MDDGPNLAVRGVGTLLVAAGLCLLVLAYRIRVGQTAVRVHQGFAVVLCALAGAAGIVAGAVLLGAPL